MKVSPIGKRFAGADIARACTGPPMLPSPRPPLATLHRHDFGIGVDPDEFGLTMKDAPRGSEIAPLKRQGLAAPIARISRYLNFLWARRECVASAERLLSRPSDGRLSPDRGLSGDA